MKATASNRILALLIKILLGLAAAGYIIYQLYYTRSTDAVRTMLADPWQDQAFPALLALVFMLMPVNWGLEALKWKLLAGKIEPITYGKSLQAVVSGLALGVLTPNRVGEFLGRMLSVEKADRREALSASVVGSFSQLIVTLIFGALASIHYLVFFSSARLEINNTLIYTLAGSFLICCVLVLVIYFHLGLLYKAEPRK